VEVGEDDLYCLWPPNHWYVCFDKGQFSPTITDNCSEPIEWTLDGCASDQPDDAKDDAWPGWNGDGRTTRDCAADPAGGGFCVRAERAGGGPDAQAGRRYAVTIVAADACGNTAAPSPIGNVHVPHDQSPRAKSCVKSTREGFRPNEPIPYE
jgi:hypothetical protein